MFMAGQSYPTKIAPTAHVSELGETPKLVSGARVEETEIALLVSDTGRPGFPTANFKTFAVGTTATSLDQLTTNKDEPIFRRGIQLFAPSSNTADVVIGGADVAASATVANINGLPLPPGSSIFLEVTRLSEIYVDTTSATQYLHWIGY
jgi:hypothetical protein